jgi:hypothetical protein
MWTGGLEPPQRRGNGVTARGARRCSASTRKGDRPESNRYCEAHNLGCWPLHHDHHGAGTAGLEPAASRLTSERSAHLSYAPVELRGRDSNPRSRAHEAHEDSRSSTARVWPAGIEPAISGSQSRRDAVFPTASRSTPGGTRTRSFRVEGPASSPVRPRGLEAKSSGGRTRTRLSRLTVGRLTDSPPPERNGR